MKFIANLSPICGNTISETELVIHSSLQEKTVSDKPNKAWSSIKTSSQRGDRWQLGAQAKRIHPEAYSASIVPSDEDKTPPVQLPPSLSPHGV